MDVKKLFLTKDQFAELKEKGVIRLTIPVPTDLLHVERLEGEKELSAWTIEDYIKKGKAYRKCTRLRPFGPKFLSRYIYAKVKYVREIEFCTWEELGVFKVDGAWCWTVELSVHCLRKPEVNP